MKNDPFELHKHEADINGKCQNPHCKDIRARVDAIITVAKTGKFKDKITGVTACTEALLLLGAEVGIDGPHLAHALLLHWITYHNEKDNGQKEED